MKKIMDVMYCCDWNVFFVHNRDDIYSYGLYEVAQKKSLIYFSTTVVYGPFKGRFLLFKSAKCGKETLVAESSDDIGKRAENCAIGLMNKGIEPMFNCYGSSMNSRSGAMVKAMMNRVANELTEAKKSKASS